MTFGIMFTRVTAISYEGQDDNLGFFTLKIVDGSKEDLIISHGQAWMLGSLTCLDTVTCLVSGCNSSSSPARLSISL